MRVRAVLVCSMVLCCCGVMLAEGRWHELRNLRRHRAEQQQEDDHLPRLLDDGSRHHRSHRPRDESTEDQEEVDTPRSPVFDDYEEDEEERAPRRRLVRQRRPHHRRHRARHHRTRPTLEDLNDAALYMEYDEGADLARDKRHQRRKNWTEDDWKAFESSRRPELYDHDIHVFELEVREAQNSSLCNYTVIPIPDPGGRVPRVLEHVKCNYVGNWCRERGSYCCVQTYRNVEVTYPGDRNDTIKVYSGCVCALQIYGTLEPYNPKLPLDD